MNSPQEIAKQFDWELDYLTDGSPIFQCKKLYTFTSDSVVLAKFVKQEQIQTLVDFCSGSGIVGLEVCGRIKTDILHQFELQSELAELCKYTNMFNNTGTKIHLHNCTLENANDYVESADVVVCNPPYFKIGSGKVNVDASRTLARHEIGITLEQIIISANNILRVGGSLYLIHIEERFNETLRLARKYNFEVGDLVHLEGVKLKRFLIRLIKK